MYPFNVQNKFFFVLTISDAKMLFTFNLLENISLDIT